MIHRRGFRTTVSLSLLAGSLLSLGCDEKHPRLEATPPPTVLVARPVERTVTDTRVFTARTQAVQSVDVKARVTGYLTAIRFKDGDEVEKGAVLFQIDDRPYKAALDRAKGDLDLARARLVTAQADYDIGLAVQKDNPAAISKQEITRRLGSRDEAKANIEQAEASLESAQLNYNWCKVTSPLSGRINRHFVDVGNLVTQDTTTLTNIVSLRPTWAYFDVDQDTVLRFQQLVKEGKVKSVRETELPVAMSLGADTSFRIAGVLDFVSNQLDPNTGSIRVRAVFPNVDGGLSAGLFARVRVPTSAPHPALLVADEAVGTDQGQKFLLVVNDADEVEYRAVDVGQVHEGLREVLRYRTITETHPDGPDTTKQVEVLRPTDWVIVDGLQRVRPGFKVAPRRVNMQTLLPESGKETKAAP
jgi:RND family efflux transporter MFP subunit